MKKTALRRVNTTARNRRRHLVPSHPPIDVLESRGRPMTLKLIALSQRGSTTAVALNFTDQPKNLRGSIFREIVKLIAALSGFIQSANHLPNRLRRSRLLCE